MNTIVKSAIAGALALGATGAYAAGVGLPSTNSSDLILYVDALSSSGSSNGVYALDTGVSISSLLPGPFVNGAQNSTAFAGVSKTIFASTALQTFLSSHSASTIEWTVEGGQYNLMDTSTGASRADATNTHNAGSALVAFSSKSIQGAGTTPNVWTGVASNLVTFLNNFQTDLGASGGIHGLTTASETTGTEGAGLQAQNKYGVIGGNDLSVTGAGKVDFFGFTGNNSSGQVQSYLIGTASLGANGELILSGGGTPPPVPLPPAVWLFGSGLLGLVGVSRRRKAAV